MARNYFAIVELTAKWRCDSCGSPYVVNSFDTNEDLRDRYINIYASLPENWVILHGDNEHKAEVLCASCSKKRFTE